MAYPHSSCDFLERAGRWFLESGIQEPFGGVARYYRSDLGSNALVSTEITGYTMSALLYLHARTGAAEYMDAALRAGRFLLNAAWDAEARTFPFEFSLNGDVPQRRAYFFDLGVIARALLALARARGEAEFRNAAAACAQSMARDFAAGRGYHPVLALPSKEPLPVEPRWSCAPGCYQLKAALAWNELGGDFTTHYDRLLQFSLATESSFLPGERERERVMDRLHAYCYFLEGLLPCAARRKYAQALRAGIARVAALLAGMAPEFERSDVCAQLLRLRLFAAALGACPLDEAAAAREAARIACYQFEHPDRRISGGVYFGRRGSALLPYVNPVSTAFCLQALELWAQFQSGQFQPEWRALI